VVVTVVDVRVIVDLVDVVEVLDVLVEDVVVVEVRVVVGQPLPSRLQHQCFFLADHNSTTPMAQLYRGSNVVVVVVVVISTHMSLQLKA
jgi:hypothetical protein